MQIILNLEEHGWLGISFQTPDGTEIEHSLSFLSDAVREMAEKGAMLTGVIQEVTMTLQTEPGEIRIVVSRQSPDVCHFRLYEMDDNFTTQQTESGRLMLATSVKTLRLLRILHRELTKMKDLGEEEYERRWTYAFPAAAYDSIKQAIDEAKQACKLVIRKPTS
ncbi:hypothetical protein [Paenibacillus sp. 1P07SE]|uniref:hypothetical protein n=1 Tax=Paenibacillus sp. 1P07SE TaxID=3132209 RepID=UPI0039A51FC7